MLFLPVNGVGNNMNFIDAEKFKRTLIDEYSFFPAIVAKALEEATAEDVAEVKHSKWFTLRKCSIAGIYCSNCRKKVYKENYKGILSKYCPHCGARMDGGV